MRSAKVQRDNKMTQRRRKTLSPMTVCRQRRQALGMSQDKLAALSGVIQPYISDIELMRHRGYPDVLAAVAKVLGVEDPDTLMKEVV